MELVLIADTLDKYYLSSREVPTQQLIEFSQYIIVDLLTENGQLYQLVSMEYYKITRHRIRDIYTMLKKLSLKECRFQGLASSLFAIRNTVSHGYTITIDLISTLCRHISKYTDSNNLVYMRNIISDIEVVSMRLIPSSCLFCFHTDNVHNAQCIDGL